MPSGSRVRHLRPRCLGIGIDSREVAKDQLIRDCRHVARGLGRNAGFTLAVVLTLAIGIGRCGGLTIVQDPKDAAYPGMPQSALDNLDVDFCVPLAEMGQLLTALVSKPHGKAKPIPGDVRTEAKIAERVLSDVDQVNRLGDPVPYNCPNCGGVLWEMGASKAKRYRCHTGHSFTQQTLLASQSEKIEELLWISLRMFEKRKNLLMSMEKVHRSLKSSHRKRLGETAGYIDRIRSLLLSPQSQSDDDTLTRVKGLMAEPRKAHSAR